MSTVTSHARPISWSQRSGYRLTLLPRPDLPRPELPRVGSVDPVGAKDRAGLLERHRRLALGADAGLAVAVFLPLAWFASWPGAGPGAWFAVLVPLALWARRLVHRSIAGQPQRGRTVRRVLVVGSPDSASRMISYLDSEPDRRLVPIGAYLRLGPTVAASPVCELPVVEILDVVGEVSADTVVLADDHAGCPDRHAIAEMRSALADRAVVLMAGRDNVAEDRGREQRRRPGGVACGTVRWASAAVQSSWFVQRRPR